VLKLNEIHSAQERMMRTPSGTGIGTASRTLQAILLVLIAACAMSLQTRSIRFTSGNVAAVIPVPLLSTSTKGDPANRLVWMIEEKVYFGWGLSRKGWNQVEQLGSMHYYSNGTVTIGILRKRESILAHRLAFSLVEATPDTEH
jgi:hypothetical protein